MAPRLEFDRPPVVSVSLTVFFEPVNGLQASHLSSLRERWRDHYPNLAELPPLRPRNRGGDEATLVPIESWPCPYVMFSSDDDQSSIAIQGDRFIRSWSFNAEDAGDDLYPGYEVMRSDLAQHFDEFTKTIESELEQTVVITGSECDYLNLLDNDIPTESLMVGVMTKWSTDVEDPVSSALTYGGVRLHLCESPELEGCAVTLRLDVDRDAPTLGIDSAFELSENEGDVVDLGGLDRAHEKLIDAFLDYTSDGMQVKWGKKRA